MDGINPWWEARPGERFWVGVMRHDAAGELLAVPCGSGRSTASGSHPLIRHVRGGDIVFLFDEDRDAIVAWSFARGRVRKRRIARASPGRDSGPRGARPGAQPSWTIRLDPPFALDEVVTLARIARLQSESFLALRQLEDQVGAPLHYPFSLGNADETHLLAGRVFKLPALLVDASPALARAVSAHRLALR